MKKSLIFPVFFSFFTSLTALAGYETKVDGFYLKHFDTSKDLKDNNCKQFLSTVIRGGAPVFDGSDLWIKKLKDNKVKRVFDLREETTNAEKERDLLLKNGIEYVKIPLRTSGQSMPSTFTIEEAIGGTITKKTINSTDATIHALNLMEEIISKQSLDDKIYLHCQRGEDRTGLMIALLRNCSSSKAYKREFLEYGGVMYKPLQKLMDSVNQSRKL